jgi:hypothetical protein
MTPFFARRYAFTDFGFATATVEKDLWMITPASDNENKLFDILAGATETNLDSTWQLGKKTPLPDKVTPSVWTPTNLYGITDGVGGAWIGEFAWCLVNGWHELFELHSYRCNID